MEARRSQNSSSIMKYCLKHYGEIKTMIKNYVGSLKNTSIYYIHNQPNFVEKKLQISIWKWAIVARRRLELANNFFKERLLKSRGSNFLPSKIILNIEL